MGRSRRGTPIHGWLVVDKPAGISSAGVVAAVRRITDAAKAGHGGALDPLATGVLPVALGEATKTVAYILDGDKRYRVTARWGEARDTDDADGAVTLSRGERPTPAEIRQALEGFVGVIDQVPPCYSAIKLAGRRAYKLARDGATVELAARRVTIFEAVLVATPDADHAVIDVACAKGTYMRSLVRDLALRLGTVGHVAGLRRLNAGPFAESAAISLETLALLWDSGAALRHLLPVEAALDGIPALALTETQAGYLRQGRPVRLLTGSRAVMAGAVVAGGLADGEPEATGGLEDGAVLCAMAGGRPVALARLRGGEIHPLRVLNL